MEDGGQEGGAAVEARGTRAGMWQVCDGGSTPFITSKRVWVTSAPKAKTSWLIADRAGRVSSQSWESSQARIERSPGTDRPNSSATLRAATAMMSLSNMIAVGRLGASSRLRQARRP